MVQNLGLIENPQTPAVQAEPENCVDVGRSAQIQGSASDQTPTQGTDGSASCTPRIVSPGEACFTDLPSSVSERCQARRQQVEPPWWKPVPEDSVTCSSWIGNASLEFPVVPERSVPGLQQEAPRGRADSKAATSALCKPRNGANNKQLGTSSTQWTDRSVPWAPLTLSSGGGCSTAVPTSESQGSLACTQQLGPPWQNPSSEDKVTCTSSPKNASTEFLLTPERSVPGPQQAAPWQRAKGNISTSASDTPWNGVGPQ